MHAVIYLVLAIIVAVAGLRYFEHTSIFYPVRAIYGTPAAMGLPFEDIFIKTQDNVTINAWLIKSSTARGTLIFCHGNAGNIGDRLAKIRLFHQMGLNVLILDYRGYGKSHGTPSETGIYKDAVAAYDYLLARNDIDHSRIIGYGESLGGAVIIDLGTRRNMAALIIDSAFTNLADMARKVYPFIPSFLLGTKMDSIDKVSSITAPKLFIHSRTDEIVPFQQGERLYQAASKPKEFMEIYGGHNDMPMDTQEKMAREIIVFLRQYNVIK